MKIWILLFILFPLITFAQLSNNKKLVDSLKFVTDMPFACEMVLKNNTVINRDTMIYNIGCGDKIFWQVVKGKKEVIPLLIDKLDDTTQTIATVQYFGGQYTVADIAYTALEEIIKDIPTFELLNVKFDTDGCGYCSYWNFLRNNPKNRKEFKVAVYEWYEKNQINLIWVKSNQFLTFDFSGFNHPNGGHFELKK